MSHDARSWLLGPVDLEFDRIRAKRRESLERGLDALANMSALRLGGRLRLERDRLGIGPITLSVDRERGEARASYGPYAVGHFDCDPERLLKDVRDILAAARSPGDLAETLHGAYESAMTQRRRGQVPDPEVVPIAEFGIELRLAVLRKHLAGDFRRKLEEPPWPDYALPWNLACYQAKVPRRSRMLVFRGPGEPSSGAGSRADPIVTVVWLSGTSTRRFGGVCIAGRR